MLDSMANPSQLWRTIEIEATELLRASPELKPWFEQSIFKHFSFEQALAHQMAQQLSCTSIELEALESHFTSALAADSSLLEYALLDLAAYFRRDPACEYHLVPLLYLKGYQALQAQRLAHYMWNHSQVALAYYLQSQMSCRLGVDIHPAVVLGHGIMIDHATSVVMGETARVGNNVSILHGVTLGGCGIQEGRRHPVIGDDALLAAGAKILGPINIGEGAKIAAGSLVLEDIPAHCTAVGVPARVVGRSKSLQPAQDMDQSFD